MATKGASYKYGNTNGSNGEGKPTEHINYQYAKDYNKNKLTADFKKHGSSFGVNTEQTYESSAVRFANTVDRKNCVSFVDKRGTTHKYNKQTNTYIAVDKKGYVVTYFKPTQGYKYYLIKKGEKKK